MTLTLRHLLTAFDKDSVCRPDLVPAKDDIAAICCPHEIIKNICIFCRDDPDEPDYKLGKVKYLFFINGGDNLWGGQYSIFILNIA